jgi:transcriptional regulator with PAS, ATPase and Fis domain
MYIQAWQFTYRESISHLPISVFRQIYRDLRVIGFDEWMILPRENELTIVAVSSSQSEHYTEISALLDENTELPTAADPPKTMKQNEAITALFNYILGKHDRQICNPDALTRIKEMFNLALEANSAGIYLTQLYRQGLDFGQSVRRNPAISGNCITAAEAILDIARKIAESISGFNILLAGNQRNRLENFRRILSGNFKKTPLLYTGEDTIDHALAASLGFVPVSHDQIGDLLDSNTIIINTLAAGNAQTRFWQSLESAVNQNRSSLYICFNTTGNGSNYLPFRARNVFAQGNDHIISVIDLHLQKRRAFLDTLKPQIESEIEHFFHWSFSADRNQFAGIVSQDRSMQHTFELIRRVAPSDVSVLINGETGTGKELVAHAIHDYSKRKTGRFIAINCSAFPESLLESELFGHEKGAFTSAVSQKKGLVELASGGTLFLDEIGDISPLIQVKLLRMLQEREIMRLGNPVPIKVDVRILAATNRDLSALITDNKFRSDLFYRINTVQIVVPPLRERSQDIILLARHFIDKSNSRLEKNISEIDDDVLDALAGYQWPGNVRELENVIEHAVAVSVGSRLTHTDLPGHLFRPVSRKTAISDHSGGSLKEIEERHIRDLLDAENQNYARVAELLGIGRTTLWRKMKEYGISR